MFSRRRVYKKFRSFRSVDLLYIIIFFLLTLIAAFRPIGFDRDSINYVSLVDLYNIHYTKINFLDKEPSFWLILYLNKLFFNGSVRIFFLEYAFIGIFINLYAMRKLSPSPLLSLLIWIAIYFPLYAMTQIRVCVAAGILLLSIEDVVCKDWKKFLLKILMASLFHYSALLFVIIYFLNVRKMQRLIWFFLPLIGILIYRLFPILILSVADKVELLHKIVLYWNLKNIGVLNQIKFLTPNLIFLALIYYISLSGDIKNPYFILSLKLLGLSFFFFYALYEIPVLSVRLYELFRIGILLYIPFFISNIYPNKFKILCSYFILLFLVAYAIKLYMVLFSWRLILKWI